jgi:hypothetical protein
MRPRIALLAASVALAATLFPVARVFAQDCSTGGALRVIQSSPDAGAVDVLIGGQVVATNVAFPNTTAYLPVAAGTVSLQLNQTGTQTAVLGPVDVTVAAGGRVTVAVAGQTEAGGGQQPTKPTLSVQVFQDDVTPAAAGQAKIRVVNASADVGAVDILAGDQVLVSNLAFPTASAFLEVPAGQFAIRANTTGTTTTVTGPVDATLVAGRTYTIFLTGSAANMTLAANLVIDRAFDAQARFIHASPDAPAIDVIADGRAVVTNLAFPNATPYVPVAAGGTCVFVTPTGAQDKVIQPISLDFQSASRQTIVALGLATGTPALSLAVFSDETTPPAADMAKIRVIHASPDAGNVDIRSGDNVLISNLEFGRASDFVEVAAGTLAIRVNKTGTTDTVLGPIDLTVSGGQIINLIVRGRTADMTVGLTLISDVSGG